MELIKDHPHIRGLISHAAYRPVPHLSPLRYPSFALPRPGATQCYELAKAIFVAESFDLDGREAELAKHRWLQDYIVAFSNEDQIRYMGDIELLNFGQKEGQVVVHDEAAV